MVGEPEEAHGVGGLEPGGFELRTFYWVLRLLVRDPVQTPLTVAAGRMQAPHARAMQ